MIFIKLWVLIWSSGYKTFFMLNSNEHEIDPTHKYYFFLFQHLLDLELWDSVKSKN